MEAEAVEAVKVEVAAAVQVKVAAAAVALVSERRGVAQLIDVYFAGLERGRGFAVPLLQSLAHLYQRREWPHQVLNCLALLLLLVRHASGSATTCAAGSYSYNSGSCAACPSGASFVAATGLCAPAAAPSDTAFYLSGSQAEGVAAFPGAPAMSFTTSVFGAANGALSFASGASYLSMTPAAGSALPTGNAAFTASAWYKCAAGGTMTAVSWGAPAMSGASSTAAVTLAAGTAYYNGEMALAAGTVGTLGSGFNNPYGVAVDAAGNVFVADTGNHAVKKMSPAGSVSALNGHYSDPYAVAVDAAGNVFVADNVVKKISLAGTVSSLGSGFSQPHGVAVDAAGNVFVADTGNDAVKKISLVGTVSTLASGFNNPRGIAVDAAGNVFVADTNNNAVKKISLDGTVSMFGSGFNNPRGVAVDAAGKVFVADYGDNAVKKISLDGTVSTLASGFYPMGVAVDAAGNVFGVDTRINTVKIIAQATTQSFCDSAWHHLAVTHGDGASSATKTYLDGALIATSQQTFAIPSDGSASLTVNWNGVTGISAGAVSDVRLYSRALSAAEALTLSQPPLTGYPYTAVAPAAPVLGATSYAFSCAAGSSGSGATQIRGLDRSWSWAAGAGPSCAPCAAGSWSGPGSPSCILCSPGTYSSAGASSCTPCPAGTYGSSAGLTSSACTGPCASTAACPLGTAYPPPAVPVTGLSCASSAARAVPSSLGVLLWPAANPSNPQRVDLVIAPLATCQQLGGTCSTLTSNTVVGADGVTRYIVGTAAALNIEAAESLACSAA